MWGRLPRLGRRPARTECSEPGMPLFALLFEEKCPINRTPTARVQLASAACGTTSRVILLPPLTPPDELLLIIIIEPI